MTDQVVQEKPLRLYEPVQLVSTLIFGDGQPRAGTVDKLADGEGLVTVRVEGESIFLGDAGPMYVKSKPEHLIRSGGAVNPLDAALDEVRRLRDRLSEIGTTAAEWATIRADSPSGRQFAQLARLARQR